ncbi:MAG: hypothetical protein DWQ10_01855 [Calditrichaeota bacterium]|nr:MAG: hypothetical protein DWQ10_01855 [Calditrichota bacterium]
MLGIFRYKPDFYAGNSRRFSLRAVVCFFCLPFSYMGENVPGTFLKCLARERRFMKVSILIYTWM